MPPANREDTGGPPIRELALPTEIKAKKKKSKVKDAGSRASSCSPQSSTYCEETFDHDEQALRDLCFDEVSKQAMSVNSRKPKNQSSNSRDGSNDTGSIRSDRKRGKGSFNRSSASDTKADGSRSGTEDSHKNNAVDFLAMFCGPAGVMNEEAENKTPSRRDDAPIEKTSINSRPKIGDEPSTSSSKKSGKSRRSRDTAQRKSNQQQTQRNVSNSRNVSSFAKPSKNQDDALDRDDRPVKSGAGLVAGDELVVPLKRIPSWTSELTGLTTAFPGLHDEDDDEDEEDEEDGEDYEDDDEEEEDDVSDLDDFEEVGIVETVKPVGKSAALRAPEESALRTRDNQRETGERSVAFKDVQYRNYERIIDDNPSVTAGPGIGIGWRFSEGECVDVDDWEEERGDRRRGTELVLHRDDREQLLHELGYTEKDIANVVRKIVKSKNQRKQTVNNLGAQSVEETLEAAGKKVRGIMQFVRRSKA